MKRNLAIPGKIRGRKTVARFELIGCDNILNGNDNFGTHIGGQVACRLDLRYEGFSAWYSPFEMIIRCYY